MNNTDIARRLLQHADGLDRIDPNLYRRRAFRRAAATVLAQVQSIEDLLQERGRAGLRDLNGIGTSLALAIEGLVLRGEIPPSRSVKKTARVPVSINSGEV